MKVCKRCDKTKTLENYRSRDRNKNGVIYYSTICKACENIDSKARYKIDYAARRNHHCAKTIAAKIPNKLKVIEYLKTHACAALHGKIRPLSTPIIIYACFLI